MPQWMSRSRAPELSERLDLTATMTQAFVLLGTDAPVEAGTRTPRAPASSPNATRKAMIEVSRRGRSVRSSLAQVRDAGATPPRAEHKVTVKEMVVWFSKDHKALKLPQLAKVGTEKDGNTNENRNSISSKSHPHIKHRSGEPADTIKAKPEETTADRVKESQNLQVTDELQLQNQEDHKVGAPAERKLEVEVKLCGQESGGLHGGNQQQTNSVTETASLTMKHEGDTDINQTVEYHENILEMQRKFEDMCSQLRNTRTDLACVKHSVVNCARVRCRCCWCRAYTGMQNAYIRLRSMVHITGNQVRAHLKERNRVGMRRRSFNLKLCCVYISLRPSDS